MALTSAHWKKLKPLTLLSEPLTKAIKDFEKASGDLMKEGTRENLAAASGGLKNVLAAIAVTSGKCNKTLHKDCIKGLLEMETTAKVAYNIVQTEQKEFVKQLGEYQKVRDRAATYMEAIAKAPTAEKIDKGLKDLETFLNFLNDGLKEGNCSSDEMQKGMKYLAATMVLLKDMKKEWAKSVVNDKQREGQAKELLATVPKIKALGGYSERPKAAMSYAIVLKK